MADSWGRLWGGGNDNGPGTFLYCMYCHLGILFSLDAYLAQPGCSGEGLGLPTGQHIARESIVVITTQTLQETRERKSIKNKTCLSMILL